MSVRSKSTKSDEFSDSEDNRSILSDRSDRKRSTYSESFSGSDRSYQTDSRRKSSGKYTPSEVSKTTQVTNTTRHSQITMQRSNISSAIRSIGKKRSAATSKIVTNNAKKLDPVTARILSANHRRRAQANNHAGEIRQENQKLQNELKSLRIQCKRQEKALKTFESTQSALPQVLQQFEDDKRVLKDRLRKAKESERRLEKDKKRVELEKEKQNRKLRELNEIIQTKNLAEKYDWQQKYTDADERARIAQESLSEKTKSAALQAQSLERQLKKEARRRAKAEKTLQATQAELRTIQEKIKERDRQLSVLNIYSQRNKKSSRNLSFQDDREISLLSINYPESDSPLKKFESSPVSVDPTPTMIPERCESIKSPIHPAFLTEMLPDESPEKPNLSPVPTPISKSQSEESVEPVKQQKSEKSADDLLDEMLGLTESISLNPKVKPAVKSPTILDFGTVNEPILTSVNNADTEVSPQFSFEPVNSSKKDSILAQLRDLHANAEPETFVQERKKEEKKKQSIFNIFDDAPSEPTIDPKELKMQRKQPSIESIPNINESGDDDVDQLLNLKPTRKGSGTKRLDYDFSQPIKNLHEGKASNGNDYRTPKKENLIDNLFGNTGRSTQMSTSSHIIGAHGHSSSREKRIKSGQRQKPIFLF